MRMESENLKKRIKENFETIANSKSPYPDSGAVMQYKRDIRTLCEEYPTPDTMNFAMDLMNELCDRIRKSDAVHLAFLQNYTYECFRF